MSCDEDEDLFGGSDEDDGEVEDEDEVEDGGASGSSGGSPGGGGAVQQSSRVECTSGLDTLWSTYGKNPDGSIIVTTSGKHVGKQKHDKVSTGRKFSDGSDDWYEFVWIHRPNAPFTYKWSSKITDSHKLGTALNSHINRYIKGNTTGLDGLATGQQAFVDVAAHAQAALPHLQAIASAAQTGNRALNTAAVNMGGTVVPLPSSSTSAPLCAAAPSSAASQLAPSGSTGAAQPNAAPAAASDNLFRKGSSLQDTDVTRLLGASKKMRGIRRSVQLAPLDSDRVDASSGEGASKKMRGVKRKESEEMDEAPKKNTKRRRDSTDENSPPCSPSSSAAPKAPAAGAAATAKPLSLPAPIAQPPPPPQNQAALVQARLPGAPDPQWLSTYPRKEQYLLRHFGWPVTRLRDGAAGIVKAVNGHSVTLQWGETTETIADAARAGPRGAHSVTSINATEEDHFEKLVRRGVFVLGQPQQDASMTDPTCGPMCPACPAQLGVGAHAWSRCWSCDAQEPGAQSGTGSRSRKNDEYAWAASTLAQNDSDSDSDA